MNLMKPQTDDLIRHIHSVSGGSLDIFECHAGDLIPAPQSFRVRELSFEIEAHGAWRSLAFQVERWQGKLFDAHAAIPGGDEGLLPNDMIVMDTAGLRWHDGETKTIRIRRVSGSPVTNSTRTILFDDGCRTDSESMARHLMPDGRPLPLHPRRDIHFINDAKSNQNGKGYFGFSVNEPMMVHYPDGRAQATTGYGTVVSVVNGQKTTCATIKCVNTANMGDPLVAGSCMLVPYHVFDPHEPGYDLLCGYPSWQMFSDVGPLYATPKRIDVLLEGPVRTILRATADRYNYDANALCGRPCDNTTLCIISGGGERPLTFEYRMAIQGHGSFTLSYVNGAQLAGLQIVHSNYDRCFIPACGGMKMAALEDATADGLTYECDLALPAVAFWDSRRTSGCNLLTVELRELTIDAYRAKELNLWAHLSPDRPSPATEWKDWHPHMRVVEDRLFPSRGGFRGGLSLCDKRIFQKPFTATVYSVSRFTFDRASSEADACAAAERTPASLSIVAEDMQ
jgi:hypothetical protein